MIDGSTLLMIAAIIMGFLIVFPLFWCAIVLLLAHAGGWQKLARHYRAGNRPLSGTPHVGVMGMVGWVSYRFVLKVHVADEGFFLEVMPLFRVGHPRLFIPWGAISDRRPVSFAFWKTERVSIGNPVTTVITLPQGVLPAAPV
jgi:hypothetical protein